MAIYYNGNVTTVEQNPFFSGEFSYASLNETTLKITFDGTTYYCPIINEFGCHYYGGFGNQGPVFDTYPFVIQCNPDDESNSIFTASAGTYSLKIESLSINRVEFCGDVLIDLSTDTVTSPEHIVSGRIGHLADGSVVTGTGSGVSVTQDQDGYIVLPSTGGGGGGGDIATATLTYNALRGAVPFNLYAPVIVETYAEMSGTSEYLYAGATPQTVDILLYNGASYVHIDNTVASMSGDIEEDEDGYYFITGDCSITITSA